MIVTVYYKNNFYECDFDLNKVKDELNVLFVKYELKKKMVRNYLLHLNLIFLLLGNKFTSLCYAFYLSFLEKKLL